MLAQLTLQKRLRDVFATAKERNPAFSLRAFAKRIGLSPAAVSEILNGKRRVSRKMAERIGQAIQLPAVELEELLRMFAAEELSQAGGRGEDPALTQSTDRYRALAEWPHQALLGLVQTAGFRADAGWIAQRLGLRLADARGAWERLRRLGWIEHDAVADTWRVRADRSPKSVAPDDGGEPAAIAVRRERLASLELARESLESGAAELAEFGSLTLPVNPERLPEARALIAEFAARMRELLGAPAVSGEALATEVYKLGIQLFPLSEGSATPQSPGNPWIGIPTRGVGRPAEADEGLSPSGTA